SRGDFGSYWSMAQSGFDTEPPKKALSQKLEITRDFLGDKDKPIVQTTLGEEISVRIRVRALEQAESNVAIVDLLPAGFEVVMQTQAKDDSSESEANKNESSSPSPSAEGEGEGGGEGGGEGEGEGGGEGEGESEEPEKSEESGPTGGVLSVALPGSTLSVDYIDVREDRVVIYGSVGKEIETFLYKIKATNAGKVITPAAHAESMYGRSVRARGEPGRMTVVRP
ncbi:MAG TPA: hypothetical protein VF518_07670, partial [Polyangia bacterium]